MFKAFQAGCKNLTNDKKAPASAGAMEAIPGLLYFIIMYKS
jgi:hypothetical protein